jgi:hypothetical protein
MTQKISRDRGQKGRANARPLQNNDTIAITDEVAVSLMDTFPASDPPAWIPIVRVGIPQRKTTSRANRKARHL